MLEQIAVDLAIWAEVTASERGNENRMDTGGARFADELAEVLFVLSHGCLSREMVGRLHVVMAELDQHVVGPGGETHGPIPVGAEGLRARSAMRHVDAVDRCRQVFTESTTISCVIGLRGIANQFNSNRGTRLSSIRCLRLCKSVGV